MKRVCVYCGSHVGARPIYADAARLLAREMAARGLALVNGGGSVGLMGVMADEILAAGGEAIGVIPGFMVDRELAHQELSELHVVADMHERKAKMIDLSHAFVALPGGVGTLDELFEAITWQGLGLHDRPCGLLNVDGYYDTMAAFVDRAVSDGFVKAGTGRRLAIAAEPADLLARLFD